LDITALKIGCADPTRRYQSESFFGRGGALDEAYDGFEYREQQEAMSQVVGDALVDKTRVIVEAGTGTGKTLAYLMPIAALGKTAIISTATKALQGQLMESDIPKVKDAGLRVTAAVLKGKDNYVCRRKLDRAIRQLPSWAVKDSDLWKRFINWTATDQGYLDRADFPEIGEDDMAWADVTSSSRECWGKRCPVYDICYSKAARAAASVAQIVIVNHHLFFADLSIKAEGEFDGILPRCDFVVMDEAHRIEDAATSFFSTMLSQGRCKRLLSLIKKNLRNVPAGLLSAMSEFEGAYREFFGRLDEVLKDDGVKAAGSVAWRYDDVNDHEQLLDVLEVVHDRLELIDKEDIKQGGSVNLTRNQVVRVGQDRCKMLGNDWMHFAHPSGHIDEVRYVQRTKYGPKMMVSPICPGDILEEVMLPVYPAMCFTSATMAVGYDFDYFRSRVGLADYASASEHVFTSPFDYERQAATFVPDKDQLVPPNDKFFVQEAAEVIKSLIDVTEGGAFVLCTSYRNMNAFYESLKKRLGYQLLVQGKLSKSEIVRRFKQTPSVLFATASFWEGVDIPGEALRLVIMDKIPFAAFKDPLIDARVKKIKREGGNAFMEYQVPQAAIHLKQGFGRLVRRKSDWGIVSILDTRMMTARYKKKFWDALPPCVDCASVEEVQWWFEDTMEGSR